MRCSENSKNARAMKKPNEFTKSDVADSMQAAASRLGIPVEIVKRMKRNGCPAFKGSRVYLAELDRAIKAANEPDFYMFPIPVSENCNERVKNGFRQMLLLALRSHWLGAAEILEIVLQWVREIIRSWPFTRDQKKDIINLAVAIHQGLGAAMMVLDWDGTDEFLKKSAAIFANATRAVTKSELTKRHGR